MRLPLVSVLLCTRDRRNMVKMAIESYLAQKYENKELIVVDDGVDRIEDLIEGVPNATYLFVPAINLSAKRNAGILAASGEYVANFDDDDWSGPERLLQQIAPMINNPAIDITGYRTSFWWDRVDRVASHYRGGIWGATIAYRRSFALQQPWPEHMTAAEDSEFIAMASRRDGTVQLDGNDQMVCTMHHGNARRAYDKNFWPIVPAQNLPAGFRNCLGLN